jgi:hypothetical protein
VQATFPVLTIV